ncbi:MAG: phosphoribosylformylglycinamidine cyclo-ligase [Deltaproteobacteria bacterium]|nr:phosphoribosylformylglycinamidine cyclo-ligase [Deltaproteobacteria bacterium]
MTSRTKLTYRAAGVDVEAGDRLVDRIAPLARRTRIAGTMGGLGGFGGLFRLPKGYREPVLVSGTDGVGTKLRLAFDLKRHGSVGIDLVAMCVNDVLVQGARPLFFLDYFATGKLDVGTAEQVISGIARGCLEGQCTLLGGETAEMPGFYKPGEYDLAGFVVGVAERKRLVTGQRIRPGDEIIALASSGVHSNGYSLVRRIVADRKLDLRRTYAPLRRPLGEALIEPTRIYVKTVLPLLSRFDIRGMAHITGGGLPGNLPRQFPASVRPVIDRSSWSLPPVFQVLQNAGDIDDAEMLATFNCGVGYCLVVRKGQGSALVRSLRGRRERAWIIGTVERRPRGKEDFILC